MSSAFHQIGVARNTERADDLLQKVLGMRPIHVRPLSGANADDNRR